MTEERGTSYPTIKDHQRVVHGMMRGDRRRDNRETSHKRVGRALGETATKRPAVEQRALVVARDLALHDQIVAEELPVPEVTAGSAEELTFPHIANALAHEHTILATLREDMAKPDKGL